MERKQIDQRFSISDQLSESDLDTLAAEGIRLVVNFRPDGEGGDAQPLSEALATKAAALGMAYAHIPVVPNQIQPAHILQLQGLLAQHPGAAIGFCRTGNRANQVYQQALQAPVVTKPACCSQAGTETQVGLLNTVKAWFKP